MSWKDREGTGHSDRGHCQVAQCVGRGQLLKRILQSEHTASLCDSVSKTNNGRAATREIVTDACFHTLCKTRETSENIFFSSLFPITLGH